VKLRAGTASPLQHEEQPGQGERPGHPAHLPLLTADLAEPDGVGPAVGGLHPALGADVLQRKQRAGGQRGHHGHRKVPPHWHHPSGV